MFFFFHSAKHQISADDILKYFFQDRGFDISYKIFKLSRKIIKNVSPVYCLLKSPECQVSIFNRHNSEIFFLMLSRKQDLKCQIPVAEKSKKIICISKDTVC